MTARRPLLAISGAFLLAVTAAACGPKPKPVLPAKSPAPPAENPFAGAKIYGDPGFPAMLDKVAAKNPAEADALRKVAKFPVATWLDDIAAARGVGAILDDVEKQAAAAGAPMVPTFVVYDLPNRDCAAEAWDAQDKSPFLSWWRQSVPEEDRKRRVLKLDAVGALAYATASCDGNARNSSRRNGRLCARGWPGWR